MNREKEIFIDLKERSYKIEIKRGILEEIGKKIKKIKEYNKIVIITDENVGKLYLDRLTKTLREENFLVYDIIIPAGEKSKTCRGDNSS